MGKHFEKRSDTSIHWETPKWLYEILNKYFVFNDGPCPIDGEKGLLREWGTRTFVNPPYGDPEESFWIKQAIEERNNGKVIVLLLRVDTSTSRFHDLILPNYNAILFCETRLHFNNPKNGKFGRAPFANMIIVFLPNSDLKLVGTLSSENLEYVISQKGKKNLREVCSEYVVSQREKMCNEDNIGIIMKALDLEFLHLSECGDKLDRNFYYRVNEGTYQIWVRPAREKLPGDHAVAVLTWTKEELKELGKKPKDKRAARVRGKMILADVKPSSLLMEAISGTEKLIKMVKSMGVE
ncbi:MAG: hypothetical protein AYK18_17220 [Theionarchaea archaeon DG-70]|nr:MAG: hypothetical protein AYK18_17220 [Theionarchaea archaeon DG-70]